MALNKIKHISFKIKNLTMKNLQIYTEAIFQYIWYDLLFTHQHDKKLYELFYNVVIFVNREAQSYHQQKSQRYYSAKKCGELYTTETVDAKRELHSIDIISVDTFSGIPVSDNSWIAIRWT